MVAYRSLDDCTIFDFETLSQDPHTGVVVSLSMLNFSESRFTSNPYSYEDLLSQTEFIKFNVKDQIDNWGRKIQKSTLDWWSNQPTEAQKQLTPSSEDRSIQDLYSFFVVNKPTNLNKVFTRRNTFDPIFMSSIMETTSNPDPYDWWLVRDTISYIEGLSHGIDLRNDFIPEGLDDKFIKHDPRHDITMDVMRLQTLIQALGE